MDGLSAALSAGEAGADVLVLESEPTVGGSMALSGGVIWAPASYELARQWIPRGNPELQRMLVDEIEPTWDWLQAHGLPLHPAGPCLQDRMGRGRLTAGGGAAGGGWAWVGGASAGRGRRSCWTPRAAGAPRCSSERVSRPLRPARTA